MILVDRQILAVLKVAVNHLIDVIKRWIGYRYTDKHFILILFSMNRTALLLWRSRDNAVENHETLSERHEPIGEFIKRDFEKVP